MKRRLGIFSVLSVCSCSIFGNKRLPAIFFEQEGTEETTIGNFLCFLCFLLFNELLRLAPPAAGEDTAGPEGEQGET